MTPLISISPNGQAARVASLALISTNVPVPIDILISTLAAYVALQTACATPELRRLL